MRLAIHIQALVPRSAPSGPLHRDLCTEGPPRDPGTPRAPRQPSILPRAPVDPSGPQSPEDGSRRHPVGPCRSQGLQKGANRKVKSTLRLDIVGITTVRRPKTPNRKVEILISKSQKFNFLSTISTLRLGVFGRISVVKPTKSNRKVDLTLRFTTLAPGGSAEPL